MDQTDDPVTPEQANLNGTAAVGTTDSPPRIAAEAPVAEFAGLRPSFLSELAVAMRATAERERESIAGRVAEDAAAHVDKVRSRAAIETDELRRLAEEDVQHIEEWSASEMARVRAEADRKIEDRRASLDDYLKQHNEIIEHEIEGVDKAVAGYNTTLDGFFAELAHAEDPATIVARAEALPPPPDLDQVRAAARASAVAMFAEPEEPKADVGSSDDDATGDGGATAVTAATVPSDVGGESYQAAVSVAPTTVIGASADTGATDGEGASPAAIGVSGMFASAAASAEAAETAGATADAGPEPVPVMDPAATADPAWPASDPEPEPEPATIAPSTETQSAAVRLLRSVAPWTAPTHASTEPGRDSE